ncbi:MAG: prepilin-type N-terminal cleavage/methylation domain-containing protein [Candidatus Delongbacteria bacterium]|jgi:prepilin-type N-terminal cleavage/methylation domain-containing protein|nr:prepilin-type N-terminal cleavage/methylation domain-containing protein [Candidatus Delongbacteria bacterium]
MKKGMTLIELLVSALILAIGITSLMYSFVVANGIVMDNTHRINATSIINLYFEGIQRRDEIDEVRQFIGTSETGNDLVEFVPKQVTRYVGGGVSQNYWLEFDLTNVVTPDPATNLVVVVARASWDKAHVENYSDKSLYMVMFTNEPIK